MTYKERIEKEAVEKFKAANPAPANLGAGLVDTNALVAAIQAGLKSGRRDPLGEVARANAQSNLYATPKGQAGFDDFFAVANAERDTRNARTVAPAPNTVASFQRGMADGQPNIAQVDGGSGMTVRTVTGLPAGQHANATFLSGQNAPVPAFPAAALPASAVSPISGGISAAPPNQFLSNPSSLGKLDSTAMDLAGLISSFAAPAPKVGPAIGAAPAASSGALTIGAWPDVNAARRRLGVNPFKTAGSLPNSEYPGGRTKEESDAAHLQRQQAQQRDPGWLYRPSGSRL